MGCGASSNKGSDVAGPEPTVATPGQPAPPSKAPSGRDIQPTVEKTASLGHRTINDSFRVSSSRKIKISELPAITEKQVSSSKPGPPSDPATAVDGSLRTPSATRAKPAAASPQPTSVNQPASPGPPSPSAPAPPTAILPPSTSPLTRPASARPASATKASAGSTTGAPATSPATTRPASARAATASGGPAPAPFAPRPPPPSHANSSARLPPLPAGSFSNLVVAAPTDTSLRPALQVPRLNTAPVGCLVKPQSLPWGGPTDLGEMTATKVQQLAGGDGPAAQGAAAASVRQALCRAGTGTATLKALIDLEAHSALVQCLREGSAEAQMDAAWSLAVLAASPDHSQVEALCNAEAPAALVRALGAGRAAALREAALWALANIAGSIHPGMQTQALAAEVLDAGGLSAVCGVLESEAGPSSAPAAPATPLMRCAAWCLHNLAKHKREKDMVNVIPLATRLVLSASDPELLACLTWVLAFLGSNEDNKSHMKQALPVLPRLVQWVRDASTCLATPSLLCIGTMCTGYMRALDYSGQVVEAGGVPAMLSYLRTGSSSGKREMVKEALFALSNVAGTNNGTVKEMLDEGVFPAVLQLLRSSAAGGDEELLEECLYVLTNPWDPLVGAEVTTVQRLLDCYILNELHALLQPDAAPRRLALLLKGLTDALKRGQQLMTHAATLQLVELGREGAAAAPPARNPVVDLYRQLGTVEAIARLNGHRDEEVATRANGIMTMLKFMD